MNLLVPSDSDGSSTTSRRDNVHYGKGFGVLISDFEIAKPPIRRGEVKSSFMAGIFTADRNVFICDAK